MHKILLVEDDEEIVTCLMQFLNSEGYSVKSASGQSGALRLLEDETFDPRAPSSPARRRSA